MLTSIECRSKAEEKIRQAEREPDIGLASSLPLKLGLFSRVK